MSKDIEKEIVDEEEELEEEEERGPGKLSLALNSRFHHLDRGGTLGGEIISGLTMALLTICVIFMNMQLIGNLIVGSYVPGNSPLDADNISAAMTYARLYAGGVLVSVIGTIAIGIAANLPLVQISTMGIFSSIICLVGAESGLTYQNLLVINLFAGVIYAIFAAVPALNRILRSAVPAAVRKALPAALGAILFAAALRLSGFVTFGEFTFGLNGGNVIAVPNGVVFNSRTLQLCAVVGAFAAAAIYVLFRLMKRNHAALFSLILGTAVYALLTMAIGGGADTSNSESFINFGRVWLIAGSQASAQTPFADSYLSYAAAACGAAFSTVTELFAQGLDFSAYSGSGVALVIGACLTYLLTGVCSAEGVTAAVDETAGSGRVLLVNGVTNAAAPFLGMGGVTVSRVSAAGAGDGAKSGLAAVAAGIFTLVSLFVMAFPALFATETYPVGSMNQWNYFAYGNGGFIYLVQGAVFSIVDIVMAAVGVTMVLGSFKSAAGKELVPVIVMLIAGLATGNVAAAAALGTLFAIILDRKSATVPAAALTVLGLLSVFLI